MRKLWLIVGGLVLCCVANAFGGQADQNDFDALLRSKQELILEVDRKFNTLDMFRTETIQAYRSGMADVLERFRQLRFLILLGDHSPYEVRRYFKQATGLKHEFMAIEAEARRHARRIQGNKGMITQADKELGFLLQSASETRKKEIEATLAALARFETSLVGFEQAYAVVLAQAEREGEKIREFHQAVNHQMEKIWLSYLTRPVYGYFNINALEFSNSR